MFDEKFKKLIIYLKVSSNYLSKTRYSNLVKFLVDNLALLGVDKKYFNEIEELLRIQKDVVKRTGGIESLDIGIEYNRKSAESPNPIFNKYFDLYLELSELCDKKNAKINLIYWVDFIKALETSEQINNIELKKINEQTIKKVKEGFKHLAENIFYKDNPNKNYKSKKANRVWTDYRYQKYMNECLLDSFNELKKEQINWLTNRNNDELNNFSKLIEIIKEFILDFCLDIAEIIFNKGHVSKIYSSNPKIVKKVTEKDEEMVDIMFSKKNSSELNVMLKHINNIESMTISKDKLSKWSKVNTSIFNTIEEILESGISSEEKQIGLEKAIFEYDNEFFINNLKATSNEIKIFSQEYLNISKNYDNLINDYIKYRSIKLNKLFKKDRSNAIIILMLIYMGKDRVISVVFKFILDQILFNSQYLEGINKTILLFMLAKYFTKIFMLSSVDSKNILKSVEAISNFSDLKVLIKDFKDKDYIKLGDTLFYLVNENSKLIESNLITKSPTQREIVVMIDPIYINKVISSNISLSLLPMVSKPKDVERKGDYYPYLLNNTNVLALDECSVIKGKYDQRYYTSGSEQFYKGINYINNIKFKINNAMLNIVINEWNDTESILFKGYNIAQEISDNDSQNIKSEKIKHNALYSLYYNIIHIAYLFRNQTFYLPVYADFRGRIYTLSNYLSYQGNDLARSLILFDSEEYLNKKGLECLNIYLSNLAGFDKLSWNNRLNKSNEVTKNFVEYYIDYLTNNSKDSMKKLISNVSEPFQFISIGLAKIDYLQNNKAGERSIIRNPILFDASCSGIQHISALTLDKNLATYSNVFTDKLNPSAEIPEDFYKYALELINDKLLNSENTNIKNIKLKRNTIKRTVMTVPYNISLNGIGEQLEEHFKKLWVFNKYEFIIPDELSLNGKAFSITSKDFGTLTKLIYDVLTKDIPSLKNLTNYFKNVINILNTLNLPVSWETPAGLKIKYQQIKFESKAIKNKLIQTSNPITISIPTDKIDKLKMLRSFMPNFIHSLDASNVHLLIKDLYETDRILVYTIHDCFASTPNNIELLEGKVKRAFIDIYFKDEGYLLKAHNKIIKQIKDSFEIIIENGKECIEIETTKNDTEYLELPQLPKAFQNNNLNEFVKGLLQSKYFIG